MEGDKFHLHYTVRREDNQQIVDDSRDLGLGPFELRIGKKFLIEDLEFQVKTMVVGEKKAFQLSSESCTKYPQFSIVMRNESKKKFPEKFHDHEHVDVHSCMGRHMHSSENNDLKEITMGAIPLKIEVELVQLEKAGSYTKESWEIPLKEKISLIPQLKEEGNNLFRRNEISSAIERYLLALQYVQEALSPLLTTTEDEAHSMNSIRSTCHLNLAACYLKLKDFPNCIHHAAIVLEADPHNLKALVRRGQAHLERGRDIDLASEDINQALLCGGHEDPLVLRLRVLCDETMARHSQKEKNLYFNKFN